MIQKHLPYFLKPGSQRNKPNLIWTSEIFGSWKIWAPRMLVPAWKCHVMIFKRRLLGTQISRGPKKSGAQMRLGTISVTALYQCAFFALLSCSPHIFTKIELQIFKNCLTNDSLGIIIFSSKKITFLGKFKIHSSWKHKLVSSSLCKLFLVVALFVWARVHTYPWCSVLPPEGGFVCENMNHA